MGKNPKTSKPEPTKETAVKSLKSKTEETPQPPKEKVFKNWTGKVPATLLNELCQKEKWKAEYAISEKKSLFTCKVFIKNLQNLI